MILENGKFTHARYVSSKKDIIEAIWMWDDLVESEESPYLQVQVEVDLEDPNYITLLDTFTTDEISTMTDQFSKEEEENFKNFVKEMATEFGLLYDPNADRDASAYSIDHIFESPEGDEGTDLLFNIKLKIFEMDEVVNSENDDLKKELREATTPLKAFYIAGKFLFE